MISSTLSLAELLDLVATIATLVALVYTIITVRKNTLSNQALFINKVYKDYEELNLAILQNPDTLEVIAKERGQSKADTLKDSVAALLINNAHKMSIFHQKRFIPEDVWALFKVDMKDLFAWNFIKERWLEIRTLYLPHFQEIADNLISKNK